MALLEAVAQDAAAALPSEGVMFIRCLKEHLICDFALQFWFWHFKKEAFLNIISERKLSVWENIADEYGLWWHQRVGGTIVEFFKEYLSHLLIFTHSTHNLQPINFLKKCVSICEKRHLFHNNRRTERILHYSTLYMKWCVCSSSLEVFFTFPFEHLCSTPSHFFRSIT